MLMSEQIHRWKPWTAKQPSRVDVTKVATMLGAGSTLQEVGDACGVTRERIRQIAKRHGIESGRPALLQRKEDEKQAKDDARCIAKWGCTRAEYKSIGSRAARAFREQRRNANDRGIPWEFSNTWEWWCVWRDSGKWAERGRKSGQYVMARLGDVGPYSPGNVEIKTCNENCQEGRLRALSRASNTSRN
jgi:hypothetical protein